MLTHSTPPQDIGHGVTIELRYVEGEPHGMYYEHRCVRGRMSPGWIPFKPNRPDGWDLISVEPLTLSPSLLCRACGHHGFIRQGKWVPA